MKDQRHHQVCLVTGGAGFIGSHLCDRLIEDGNEVYCLDNLLTGSLANINHLTNTPRFHFVRHDVIQKYTNFPEVDYIYHLASPASPRWYQKYPVETLLVNTCGTHLLLEEAKKQKAKFLYASTSEVYGQPLEHPQRETYSGNVVTTGPRSCYDEGKRCGESYVYTYGQKYGVNVRIIRIFNTFGPRMSREDGRALITFLYQILEGKPVTIFGDGLQTRSFCYISDMVDAIVLAMTKDTNGEIMNVGNDKEIAIIDLVKLLMEQLGKEVPIIEGEMPTDDPVRRRPDLTHTREVLGWSPTTPLQKGIADTVRSIADAV